MQHTLLPIVKQYEEEFNRKLLTKTDREKIGILNLTLNLI
ncbi:prophage L54a, portal, HK97 family domain protein [Staphylococcus aureus]|nr:prophage L54a, portal, HK97 family domain protein [Staphylococcus aureus]